MLFDIAFYTGIVLTIVLGIFNRKLMRVEFDKITKFLTFMVLLTFGKIALFSFINSFTYTGFSAPPAILGVEVWGFALVFWEDAFFAIPLIFAFKYLNKYIAIVIAVVLSLWFGYGHVYQGYWVALVISLYPYFISKYFGEKYGMGTVMICHILYDFITFYTIIFLSVLV